jgi:putative hemolysin
MLQRVHEVPDSNSANTNTKHRYVVELARSEEDILEAQRLRYRVFAEEMGARLNVKTPGVDSDIYDPFCEHLIVRDENADKIVGTYRILTPEAAMRVGNYYSENEFDLIRLQHLRGKTVEVGRSCIDAEYRNGAIISLLWTKLAEFILGNGYEYLIGCASHPLPFERLVTGVKAEVPPLVKGYLRAGAYVCGEPAWDPDFNTADLFLLLPVNRISKRYARHFIHS